AEKMFRFTQTAMEGDADYVLLKVDARNAFNSCSRQQLLDEVRDHYPELLPFFTAWYGAPGSLRFSTGDGAVHELASEDGVQQGCAAGMFLFCLGLQPHLRTLMARLSAVARQRGLPPAFVAAYADDLVCVVHRDM